MKTFVLLVATLFLAGCPLTVEQRQTVANYCQEGVKYYGYVQQANAVEPLPAQFIRAANDAYSILKPICDKGINVTEADVVSAALQAYVLTKTWREAT